MRKMRQLGIGLLVIMASLAGMLNPMVQSAKGTNVSGLISSDTTWSAIGSPYIIMGNTTVVNGATLTIEPGVEVRFDGLYALYVDGGLMARGTPSSKIIITSNKASPAPMDWAFIQINSTADAEIEYSEVSYGYSAINLEGSNDTTISNNGFTNSYFGINGGTSNSIMSNNAISSIYHGLMIVDMFQGAWNNTISNNSISNHQGYGIELYGAFNNVINNNTITNNEIGIYMMAVSNITIANNDITGNTQGLNLSQWALNNRIYHNNIIGNAVQAIDDSDSSFWNATYSQSPLMGGNYWSDYSPTCQDSFSGSATPQTTGSPDGICDNPRAIDADSIDYYPLTSLPDSASPSISDLRPGHLSTTSDNTPVIGANYSDQSGIDTGSVVLEVDGVDVTLAPGTVITATGVAYTPATALSNGNHQVYLEVNDTVGIRATASWSFTIGVISDSEPPTIVDLAPADDSVINVAFPMISANYSDGSGIDANSVVLKVDDENVTSSAVVTESGVIYVPTVGLSEGLHNVYLEVRDTNNNLANATWSFTVDVQEPSPLSGDFLSSYWWVLVILVFTVVTVLVAIILRRRKNAGKDDEKEIKQEGEIQNL